MKTFKCTKHTYIVGVAVVELLQRRLEIQHDIRTLGTLVTALLLSPAEEVKRAAKHAVMGEGTSSWVGWV